MATKILDKAWAANAFLVPATALSDTVNNRRRYYTSSSRKFTDTTLGGDFAINPLPQFTANCDFRHPSKYTSSTGKGRWYSETLDDLSQLIHIRCGVPKFNSMTNFFGNFYNVHAGAMARSGRAPDIWFKMGKIAGVVGTLPLQPFILAGGAIKFFAGIPRSKYYYLKPTMYPYWYALSNYTNAIFVNLGLSPHFVTDEQKRFFDPVSIPGQNDIDSMRRVYGKLMTSSGIDIFAMATRAQRLARQYRIATDKALEGMSDDPNRRVEEITRILLDGIDDRVMSIKDPGATLDEYEKSYLAFAGEYTDDKAYSVDVDDPSRPWYQRAWEYFRGEAETGSEFITFRVNNTGSQSESFSNSTTESSLQEDINGMSSKARMARFNLAEGNIASPIGSAIEIVKSFAAGVMEAAQIEGFMALAGNAFADIQKLYQSSSADLNRTSFTIPLRAWSHDPWVRLQNLYIPLGAILALGLPRATGPASFDGPFLLEVHNQGKTMIREGMVESISIERGSGDVGWAMGNKVLSIDVTVTIVDLSSIMSVPINPLVTPLEAAVGTAVQTVTDNAGATAKALGETVTAGLSKSTYSEDNKWIDYLSTITAIPLDVQINYTRKWKLHMARTQAAMDQWKSGARIANMMMDTTPGDLLKALSMATARD